MSATPATTPATSAREEASGSTDAATTRTKEARETATQRDESKWKTSPAEAAARAAWKAAKSPEAPQAPWKADRQMAGSAAGPQGGREKDLSQKGPGIPVKEERRQAPWHRTAEMASKQSSARDADRMKRQIVHTPPRASALSPLKAEAAAGSFERWVKDEAAVESEWRHGMPQGRHAGAAAAWKPAEGRRTQGKVRPVPPPPPPPPPRSWGQVQGSQARLTPGPKARTQFTPIRWDAPAKHTKYAPGPWGRRYQPPR